MARRHGATDEEIDWLQDPLAGGFTPAESAALALAEALTSTPAEPHDRLHRDLAAHFSEQETVEILAAIALFNFFNRLGNGVGLEG